ncbi:MAG: glycosyltransferase family 2 protein [Arcicella sp.]|jgi:glycosyltransferase involved in cell wall biosynthesis|nr:glycosyltransferase family 2 protein [Arcicella sp.]
MKISVVIITLNEERILERTLKAIHGWADEIIVVDSGSTDRTVEIAQQYDCKTMHRKFDGDGPQKHFGVNQALNDWVFVLDADEEVTPELRSEIESYFAQNHEFTGFYVPISLIFLGRLMRYGAEYKMPHLRLFNKKFGNFNDKFVHGGAVVDGKLTTFENHVLHYSYKDLHDYLQRFNYYTTRTAKMMYDAGKKGAIGQVIFRFPITFLKEYFLRKNFLNGYPGFVWAILSAMYPVVKYAKLREMWQQKK